MLQKKQTWHQSETTFYFGGNRRELAALLTHEQVVVIADKCVCDYLEHCFPNGKIITVDADEAHKTLKTVSRLIDELLRREVNRDALLLIIGGGVTCDIGGFVAGIYKRGLRFGLLPTTALSMVDAAVGGKNGVNFEQYKNMVGLVRQPEFIFYDYSVLKTLPDVEWSNGFAEIIKHACIADDKLFAFLEQHTLKEFKENENLLSQLIEWNVAIKSNIVCRDEFESGLRRKLNFGHTLAHAIEQTQGVRHGFAVAIGMVFACRFSEKKCNFLETERVLNLLKRYGLPIDRTINIEAVFPLILEDKKRVSDDVQFVFLNTIGEALTAPLPITEIKTFLATWK